MTRRPAGLQGQLCETCGYLGLDGLLVLDEPAQPLGQIGLRLIEPGDVLGEARGDGLDPRSVLVGLGGGQRQLLLLLAELLPRLLELSSDALHLRLQRDQRVCGTEQAARPAG